jgi:hypothetical protein
MVLTCTMTWKKRFFPSKMRGWLLGRPLRWTSMVPSNMGLSMVIAPLLMGTSAEQSIRPLMAWEIQGRRSTQ